MQSNEFVVAGIGVSRSIFAQITADALKNLEGVARVVGSSDIASNFISAFSRSQDPIAQAVELEIDDGALAITVHIAVFFGYAFTEIAAQVRPCVARAISEQVGCDVAAVNVCIDELVFPKG